MSGTDILGVEKIPVTWLHKIYFLLHLYVPMPYLSSTTCTPFAQKHFHAGVVIYEYYDHINTGNEKRTTSNENLSNCPKTLCIE